MPADEGFSQVDRMLGDRFGAPPHYHIRAPGRVNLIGEHTDYNEGFVLPAAVDRYVVIAAAPADDRVIRLLSTAFSGEASLPADRPEAATVPPWARYVQGVALELRRAGVVLCGLHGVIGGDLPVGAGLSSSAALEVGTALALLAAAGADRDRREIATLSRRAEEEFVGVRCGIMDQFTVALARRGHALFLDCRTLESDYLPLPAALALVVCDTGVRRALGDSAYNVRRRECDEAVERLRAVRPDVRALRDLGPQDLDVAAGLPDPLRRRVRHVAMENARVRAAVAALRRGEAGALGRLLDSSHASLRDDFEVSTPELEAMVEAARSAPGCLGARLVGAGFGGSVLALVERAAAPAFVAAARDAYRRTIQREGTFLVCEAAGAAAVTTVDRGENP